MTTDIETAASILGIARTLAFELAKTNQFPVRILRLGRRIRIPVSELLHYLGNNADENANKDTQHAHLPATPRQEGIR